MPEAQPHVVDASNALTFLDDIVVVLMRTTHPGNIGAVARAAKNMGLRDIRLVDPAEFPSDVATRRASGAEDLLERAEVFASLDEAVADCHVLVGTSARSRSMVWPLMNPRDCAEKLHALHAEQFGRGQKYKIALLFGQEASGLTNDELHRCNYHVNIPANPEYSSLNLAMAVQVITYECRFKALESAAHEEAADQLRSVLTASDEDWDVQSASIDEVEGMIGHFEKALIKVGYYDPSNPRVLMTRLRRLFQRVGMDKMEVNIFRGLSKAILERTDDKG